jgi:hypothetical protein
MSAEAQTPFMFVLQRQPHTQQRIPSDRSGEYLLTSSREIASMFGVSHGAMYLYIASVGIQLTPVDGKLEVPASLRFSGHKGPYYCSVEVDSEIDDCTTTDIDADDADAPKQTAVLPVAPIAHEQASVGRAYLYLTQGTRPEMYAGDNAGWKSFKRRVKRAYYIHPVDHLMYAKRLPGNTGYAKGLRQVVLRALDRVVVPTREEMLGILEKRHMDGHPRINKLESWAALKYRYRGLREVVKHVVSNCEVCNGLTFKTEKHAQAIITSRLWELVMFDCFDMPFKTPGGYKLILLIKDHFSKFVWGKPFKAKSMEAVADFVYTTFKDRGVPECFHCDNGSEFVNTVMHAVLMRMGNPHYTHGRPYNPQTQGLIENANGDAIRKLTAMVCNSITHVQHCPVCFPFVCMAYLLVYTRLLQGEKRTQGLHSTGTRSFRWFWTQ